MEPPSCFGDETVYPNDHLANSNGHQQYMLMKAEPDYGQNLDSMPEYRDEAELHFFAPSDEKITQQIITTVYDNNGIPTNEVMLIDGQHYQAVQQQYQPVQQQLHHNQQQELRLQHADGSIYHNNSQQHQHPVYQPAYHQPQSQQHQHERSSVIAGSFSSYLPAEQMHSVAPTTTDRTMRLDAFASAFKCLPNSGGNTVGVVIAPTVQHIGTMADCDDYVVHAPAASSSSSSPSSSASSLSSHSGDDGQFTTLRVLQPPERPLSIESMLIPIDIDEAAALSPSAPTAVTCNSNVQYASAGDQFDGAYRQNGIDSEMVTTKYEQLSSPLSQQDSNPTAFCTAANNNSSNNNSTLAANGTTTTGNSQLTPPATPPRSIASLISLSTSSPFLGTPSSTPVLLSSSSVPSPPSSMSSQSSQSISPHHFVIAPPQQENPYQQQQQQPHQFVSDAPTFTGTIAIPNTNSYTIMLPMGSNMVPTTNYTVVQHPTMVSGYALAPGPIFDQQTNTIVATMPTIANNECITMAAIPAAAAAAAASVVDANTASTTTTTASTKPAGAKRKSPAAPAASSSTTPPTAGALLCSLCGQAYRQQRNLDAHMLTHTDEQVYTCEHCPKTFNLRASMKIHMNVHYRDKPHKCTECNKSYTQAANLRSHMQTHTGNGQSFECETCGKKFGQMSSLKSHRLGHSGQKPHKCLVCDRSYTQSSSLKVHMNMHSGKKPYKCEVCEKMFSDPSNFRKHKSTTHGIFADSAAAAAKR